MFNCCWFCFVCFYLFCFFFPWFVFMFSSSFVVCWLWSVFMFSLFLFCCFFLVVSVVVSFGVACCCSVRFLFCLVLLFVSTTKRSKVKGLNRPRLYSAGDAIERQRNTLNLYSYKPQPTSNTKKQINNTTQAHTHKKNKKQQK